MLNKQAFSLIELSILITLIAIITISYMSWTTNAAINDGTKLAITRERMRIIDKAIIKFRLMNNRLPCPAMNSAAENSSYTNGGLILLADDEFINTTYASGMQCSNNIGVVPTRALGLPIDYMLDAWGRRILYHVSSSVCSSGSCLPSNYYPNVGNIAVRNMANTLLTSSAMYVLVSYGADGYGAYLPTGGQIASNASNAYEVENSNNDNNYVQNAITTGFDDITIYRTKHQIENFAYNPGITLVSFAQCQANSLSITAFNQTVAISIRNNSSLTYFQGWNPIRNVNYNFSDEAILDYMWILQDACLQLYGTSINLACPGNALWDSRTTSCLCNNLGWNYSC